MSGKRVLVFTESALALSETFIADHCRALRRYEATLVALYSSGEHHADVPRHLLFPAQPPGRLVRLAFRLGLSRRLDALIEQLKPDIIHAHYLTNGAFLQTFAKRHDVPLVVTAHGHDATRQLKRHSFYDQVYRLRRQKLKHEAALVLPVSTYLRDILLDAKFPRHRIKTHYLGIPISDEPPVPVGQSSPHMIFVGRLVEKKGIDSALEAFARIRAIRPTAELHLVGDGPLRTMVEAKAKSIGGIKLHGAQPPDRTRHLMSMARLLILPSRQAKDGDVEGFGLVLVEAQALGVPVVTSNTSGTLETVLPGKTGFAVKPSDISALTTACLQLLDDPELAKTMGAEGYRFVRAHFDIDRQTRTLEKYYDQVVADYNAARLRK